MILATFPKAATPPPAPDRVHALVQSSSHSGPTSPGTSLACDHPCAPARSENCAQANPRRSHASTSSAAPRPTVLPGPPDHAPGDPGPTPRPRTAGIATPDAGAIPRSTPVHRSIHGRALVVQSDDRSAAPTDRSLSDSGTTAPPR